MTSAEGQAARYQIQGKTVEMPVVVRDATSCAATYLVNAAAARKLTTPKLLPARREGLGVLYSP